MRRPAPQRGKRKTPASGLRIKTENKGFAGMEAQTLPAPQREIWKNPAPGLRTKTENKGFAGMEAQTEPAPQREKRKTPASGLRIKTEDKGFAGNRAQTAPARKKPPPSVSEWGKAATAYKHYSIELLRKPVTGANVFLWEVKR